MVVSGHSWMKSLPRDVFEAGGCIVGDGEGVGTVAAPDIDLLMSGGSSAGIPFSGGDLLVGGENVVVAETGGRDVCDGGAKALVSPGGKQR